MEDLAGRVAVVTGASRRIGAAVARSLSAAGVRLGLASRSGDEVVMFVLTRPRNHRILEVALRPVTETSWG